MSFTVTVKEQLAEPWMLVAVQFTVVEPTGNLVSDAGVHTTAGAGSPTVVTENVTRAEQWPGSLFRVIFAGQVIVGGVSGGGATTPAAVTRFA